MKHLLLICILSIAAPQLSDQVNLYATHCSTKDHIDFKTLAPYAYQQYQPLITLSDHANDDDKHKICKLISALGIPYKQENVHVIDARSIVNAKAKAENISKYMSWLNGNVDKTIEEIRQYMLDHFEFGSKKDAYFWHKKTDAVNDDWDGKTLKSYNILPVKKNALINTLCEQISTNRYWLELITAIAATIDTYVSDKLYFVESTNAEFQLLFPNGKEQHQRNAVITVQNKKLVSYMTSAIPVTGAHCGSDGRWFFKDDYLSSIAHELSHLIARDANDDLHFDKIGIANAYLWSRFVNAKFTTNSHNHDTSKCIEDIDKVYRAMEIELALGFENTPHDALPKDCMDIARWAAYATADFWEGFNLYGVAIVANRDGTPSIVYNKFNDYIASINACTPMRGIYTDLLPPYVTMNMEQNVIQALCNIADQPYESYMDKVKEFALEIPTTDYRDQSIYICKMYYADVEQDVLSMQINNIYRMCACDIDPPTTTSMMDGAHPNRALSANSKRGGKRMQPSYTSVHDEVSIAPKKRKKA